MNEFEYIVGKLLEEENYWIKLSVKINLSRDEKVKIGKPTTPQPEIDVVAFDQKQNLLYLIEIKSYLNGTGVKYDDLSIDEEDQKGKYKLLTSSKYRDVLTNRLIEDWVKYGLINHNTQISYGLIAGNIYNTNDEIALRNLFKDKNWMFWGPSQIRDKIIKLSKKSHENNIVTLISKIIMNL